MNWRAKAIVYSAIAAGALVGVGGLGNGVALAHTPDVSVSCENGVSWTTTSYEGTNNKVTIWWDGTDNAHIANGYPITFAVNASGTSANPDKTVSHSWKVFVDQAGGSAFDKYDKTFTGTISSCRVPITDPTVVEVKTCSNPDTFTTPSIPHVTYSPASGTVAPGDVTSVTATATGSYKFTDGTTTHVFTLHGSKKEACPVAPGLVPTTACGASDTFTTTAKEGVVYTPTGGPVAPGLHDVTVATPLNSNYQLPGGVPSITYQLTGGKIEACPVAPSLVPTTACGASDTFTTTAKEGVVYTPTGGPVAPGLHDVTVATPLNSNYQLPGGVPSITYQLTGGEIEMCGTPVAPTLIPHTVCGVLDTFTAGPTSGVLYSKDGTNFFGSVSGDVPTGTNVGIVKAKADNGYVLAPGAQTSFDLMGSVVEKCSTPVAPVVTVKTACDTLDTFTAGPTEGVLYSTDGLNYAASVSGTLNVGNNAGVVKAKPDTGYALTEGSQTSFDLTGSAKEKCGLAEQPKVVTTVECGVKDTFSAGPTEGVLYSTDGVNFTPTVAGTLDAGQVVTVTAGPDTANGYNFEVKTFPPITGGIVEACPLTVTPVAPAIVTPPCGEPATFTTTPVEGVIYSQTSGTLTPGADTVITVSAADGFVLAADAKTSYTLTGPEIAVCETTVAQVSVEPPAPTTTVVAVAPPAPEAPPLGLPETGSSNTLELLLGGFLLIAGASLLGFVRRRTVKVKG